MALEAVATCHPGQHEAPVLAWRSRQPARRRWPRPLGGHLEQLSQEMRGDWARRPPSARPRWLSPPPRAGRGRSSMRRARSSFVVSRSGEPTGSAGSPAANQATLSSPKWSPWSRSTAPLLVQLQQGQEAHDDVGQGEVRRQAAEGDGTEGRQLLGQLCHGLADAHPGGGHVSEVDPGSGPGGDGTDEGVPQLGRAHACQHVGGQPGEPLVRTRRSAAATGTPRSCARP